jgi:hypothetical protein
MEDRFHASYAAAAVYDPCKKRVLAGCSGTKTDSEVSTEYYIKVDLNSSLDGEGMAAYTRPSLDLVVVLVMNGMPSGLEACLLKTVGRLRSHDRLGVVVADGSGINVLRPLDFIKPLVDIPQLAAELTGEAGSGVPDVGEAVHLGFSLLESSDAVGEDPVAWESSQRQAEQPSRFGRLLLLLAETEAELSADFDSRIISESDSLLAWQESCDHAIHVIESHAARSSSALLSTVVLLCPTEHSVPSIMPTRIHELPGCSCLVGHDATELSWRLVEEFEFAISPIAFCVTLQIETEGFQILEGYGRTPVLPLLVHKDGQKVIIAHTAFATPDSDDGCTRGRTCLFKLRYDALNTTEDELTDKLLELRLTYTDMTGEEEHESVRLHLPNKLTSISTLDRWDSLEWHQSDFGECEQDEVDLVTSGSYRSHCSAEDGPLIPSELHSPASYYEDDSIRKAVLVARCCDVIDAVAAARAKADAQCTPSVSSAGSLSSTPEYHPVMEELLGKVSATPVVGSLARSVHSDFLDAYTNPLDALLEEWWPDPEGIRMPDISQDLKEFVGWFQRERAIISDKHTSFEDEAEMLLTLIGHHQSSESNGVPIRTRR